MVKFKEGDIVLFAYQNTAYQKAISKLTNDKYNHSGVVGEIGVMPNDPDTTDAIYIYESLGKVKKGWYEQWWVNERIKDGTIKIRRSPKPLEFVKETLEDYLDLPYDWVSIILIYVYILTGITFSRETIKNVFCSEFDSRFLFTSSNHSIDIPKEFGLPSHEYITPSHLNKTKQLVDVK